MTVAFIVGGFPRISETRILAQVTALLDRGHEVEIDARRASGEQVVHADVTEYDLMRRAFLRRPYEPDQPGHQGCRDAGCAVRLLGWPAASEYGRLCHGTGATSGVTAAGGR